MVAINTLGKTDQGISALEVVRLTLKECPFYGTLASSTMGGLRGRASQIF